MARVQGRHQGGRGKRAARDQENAAPNRRCVLRAGPRRPIQLATATGETCTSRLRVPIATETARVQHWYTRHPLFKGAAMDTAAYGIVHFFAEGTKEQYEASIAAVHPGEG